MRRTVHTQPPSQPPQSSETFRRILALAVLALFIGVCLGRLFAPQVALFSELMPVVSGLLALVVRYYFTERKGA
jgi:hypothetical protein